MSAAPPLYLFRSLCVRLLLFLFFSSFVCFELPVLRQFHWPKPNVREKGRGGVGAVCNQLSLWRTRNFARKMATGTVD